MEVGVTIGASQEMIRDAVAYTKAKYALIGGKLTPSQVFSQALLHGWDFNLPVEEAIMKVREIGAELNQSEDIVANAVAYTTAKYDYHRA